MAEHVPRTERATIALLAYEQIVGPGLNEEELISDLMTDLLHLADELHDEYGDDFSEPERFPERALMHFEAERGDRVG